jgi:hypothetical protein
MNTAWGLSALEEIRRAAAGDADDLRRAGSWPVDVVSRRETQRGQVSDLQQGLQDDAAAKRAIQSG